MIEETTLTTLDERPMNPAILARELQKTRHDSLIAMRASNFRKVAELSVRAARLNRELQEARGEERSNGAQRA
jgi:hypothetical protein